MASLRILGFSTTHLRLQSVGSNDSVGINTASSTSTLTINGSLAAASGDFTSFPLNVGAEEFIIACGGSGVRAIDLPDAPSYPGRLILIKDAVGNSQSNNIQIRSNSNIDGSSEDLILNVDKGAYTVASDGTQWLIVGKYIP